MKIVFFYIISFIILLFFWYFISCFCAVYVNTQKILIYDTLISFGTSNIYSFLFYLLPTILRLLALRAKTKNQKWLYDISLILS